MLVVVSLSLSFIACGPRKSRTVIETQPQNQSHVQQPDKLTEQKTADPQVEDTSVAQASFLKTIVSGSRSWNLNSVTLQYTKREQSSAKILEEWTTDCKPNQARVEGSYPSVSLHIPAFDCGLRNKPIELLYLELITADIGYRASHIPAYPSEPNQFSLALANDAGGELSWDSLKSLNAHTTDRALYADLLGERDGNLMGGYRSMHFLAITMQNPGGFEIDYTVDTDLGQSRTEVKIRADLVLAK